MNRYRVRQGGRFAAAFAFLACALLVGGIAIGRATMPVRAQEEGAAGGAGVSYGALYTADNPVPDIAANVRPSVVQVISMSSAWTRFDGRAEVEAGYGSGVYIDARGYIVTNYHVIEGASSVQVELLDDTRVRVTDLFYDSSTDLAVLKVDPIEGLTPVPLGDSDLLRVGELAIAIGNPGVSDSVFKGTLTVGVISALDRKGVTAGNFTRAVHTIQTDAAINAGNSGGALLNGRGELIGIPTLKIESSLLGSYEGLAFAIPINTARPIIDDLIQYGRVIRPRIGVSVSDFSGPNEASESSPPAGAQVLAVEEGSPAEEAGILRYDVITHVNGVRVRSLAAMTIELDRYFPGDTVTMTVYRFYDAQTGTRLAQPQSLDLLAVLKVID